MAAGPEKRRATEDGKAILNRLRQLVRALRVFEKDTLRRYGIGAAQMFILHILAEEDELSMNDLADRTATDQSSASLAVTQLVRKGCVRRRVGSEDRRQVLLSLTPKGRRIARRSPPAVQDLILASVASIPAADRGQLMRLLDKLMSGMGVEKGRAPMLFQDPPRPRRRPR